MTKPASELYKGQKGIIAEAQSVPIPIKLLELGCLPGNEIELIKKAPFKDPIQFRIDHSIIAIREEVARTIMVSLKDQKD